MCERNRARMQEISLLTIHKIIYTFLNWPQLRFRLGLSVFLFSVTTLFYKTYRNRGVLTQNRNIIYIPDSGRCHSIWYGPKKFVVLVQAIREQNDFVALLSSFTSVSIVARTVVASKGIIARRIFNTFIVWIGTLVNILRTVFSWNNCRS